MGYKAARDRNGTYSGRRCSPLGGSAGSSVGSTGSEKARSGSSGRESSSSRDGAATAAQYILSPRRKTYISLNDGNVPAKIALTKLSRRTKVLVYGNDDCPSKTTPVALRIIPLKMWPSSLSLCPCVKFLTIEIPYEFWVRV